MLWGNRLLAAPDARVGTGLEGEPPIVLLGPLGESGSTQVGPRSEELFLVGGNSFVTSDTQLKLSAV
jgi:hypothetical protein